MDDPLDPVFRAIANADRRRMLDLLREQPRTTGELVLAFPGLSRFAVMQHLKVLARASLVIAYHEGRVRVNRLNAVPLRAIYERWVSRYEGHWASALLALQRELEAGDGSAPSGTDASRADDAGRGEGGRSGHMRGAGGTVDPGTNEVGFRRLRPTPGTRSARSERSNSRRSQDA